MGRQPITFELDVGKQILQFPIGSCRKTGTAVVGGRCSERAPTPRAPGQMSRFVSGKQAAGAFSCSIIKRAREFNDKSGPVSTLSAQRRRPTWATPIVRDSSSRLPHHFLSRRERAPLAQKCAGRQPCQRATVAAAAADCPPLEECRPVGGSGRLGRSPVLGSIHFVSLPPLRRDGRRRHQFNSNARTMPKRAASSRCN